MSWRAPSKVAAVSGEWRVGSLTFGWLVISRLLDKGGGWISEGQGLVRVPFTAEPCFPSFSLSREVCWFVSQLKGNLPAGRRELGGR